MSAQYKESMLQGWEVRKFHRMWRDPKTSMYDMEAEFNHVVKNHKTIRAMGERMGLPLWTYIVRARRKPAVLISNQLRKEQCREPVSDNLEMRPCIHCKVPFNSTHSGHRMCGCNPEKSHDHLGHQWEYA